MPFGQNWCNSEFSAQAAVNNNMKNIEQFDDDANYAAEKLVNSGMSITANVPEILESMETMGMAPRDGTSKQTFAVRIRQVLRGNVNNCNKSYGNVVIKDAVYSANPNQQGPFFGFASYPRDIAPTTPPVKIKPSSGEINTFIVDLYYNNTQYVYNNGKGYPIGSSTSYSKHYKRISSSKNPVAAVKSFVSQFSSCDEAHKLRKRMIAMERIRNSISEETFRFPIYQ